MNPYRFQRLVAKALRELPRRFLARIENVEVLVEDEPDPRLLAEVGVPSGSTLFGLYQGVPLTERTSAYSMVLPDRLTIFQKPIERACASDWEIRHQVRQT